MKKLIILLIVLIGIIGCSPLSVNQNNHQEADNPNTEQKENNDNQINNPIKEPEEEIPPPPPPLKTTLTGATKGIVKLNETYSCNAQGGTPPYQTAWKLNNNRISCNKNCELSLPLGNYSLECTVHDSNNQSIVEQLNIEVTKEIIRIEEVITFGDSLTEGFLLEKPETENWAYQLTSEFKSANHQNFAITGQTSFQVHDVQLPKYTQDNKSQKLVFLWVGANDLINVIPVADSKPAYEKIVQQLKNIPNATIILLTVPDASQLSLAQDIENDVNNFLDEFGVTVYLKELTKDVILSYNAMIKDIAKQNDLPTIDMFEYMNEMNDSFMAEDRFHPNKEGHTLIKEKVQEELTTLFPNKEFS